KKVSMDQRAAQASDPLTAADNKTAAIEKPATPTLTFQDELTRSSAEPSTPPVISPPVVSAPVLAEAPTRTASPPVEIKQELAAPSETPRARPTVQPARPVVPTKARPAKPEGKGRNFTLQLSSTQTRADANRFAARLREKGYSPTVVEAQVPGRGTWYRVRLG